MHKRLFLAALAAATAFFCLPAQATVPSTTNTVSYTGNGSTTTFSVPFKFLQNTDLVVTVSGATKTLNSDYTVVGAGVPTGGTITFTSAPASSAPIIILRATPCLQPLSLRSNPNLDPSGIENEFDRVTMCIQDTSFTSVIGYAHGGWGGSPLTLTATTANFAGTGAHSNQFTDLTGTWGLQITNGSPQTFSTMNMTWEGQGTTGVIIDGQGSGSDDVLISGGGADISIVSNVSVNLTAENGSVNLTSSNNINMTPGGGAVIVNGIVNSAGNAFGNFSRSSVTPASPGNGNDWLGTDNEWHMRLNGVTYSPAPLKAGTTALTSGTPSTKTVTMPVTGMVCTCTETTTATNNANLKCVVASTTLTITGPNAVTDTIAYTCMVAQ